MPKYSPHQSLSGGFFLAEAAVALITLGIILAVIVALFAAGVKTFVYTLRQTSVLTNAREMYEGNGPVHGLLWSSRNAASFQDLSTSSVDLNSAGGTPLQFTLSNNTLFRTQQSVSASLGNTITTLQPAYYNMNSSGLIVVSTSASSADFVTVFVQTVSPDKKTFSFYSGARLRNHS